MNTRADMMMARVPAGAHNADKMRHAIAGVFGAVDIFAEKRGKILNDRTLSDEGKATAIKALLPDTVGRLTDIAKPIRSARDDLLVAKHKLKPPPPDPADVRGEMMRGEIRTFLRSLPVNDRDRIVRENFADVNFFQAVFHAPAILSGIQPDRIASLETEWLETNRPGEMAQLAAMADAVENAEAARQIASNDLVQATGLPFHEFQNMVAKAEGAGQ